MIEQDFQGYLQDEFKRRVSGNSRYSLRAFARDLGLEPSLLSRIMRKRVRLTELMFYRIADRLKIPKEVSISLRKRTFPKNLAQYSLEDDRITYLNASEFILVSDWYYYAILEMTSLKNFKADTQWIAQRLQIDKDLVVSAVQRLFDLGLLIKTPDSWYASTEFTSTLKKPEAMQAIQMRHYQILEKALNGIESIPLSQRDYSAITLTMDPDLLPTIQNKIIEFRRSLATFIEKESKGNNTEVYEMAIALFPLTKAEESLD